MPLSAADIRARLVDPLTKIETGVIAEKLIGMYEGKMEVVIAKLWSQ